MEPVENVSCRNIVPWWVSLVPGEDMYHYHLQAVLQHAAVEVWPEPHCQDNHGGQKPGPVGGGLKLLAQSVLMVYCITEEWEEHIIPGP